MDKVFCYRNLNRKGVVWSVKDTKSGLVIDRSTNVVLSGVDLKVSQAGRARVIKNKRKNVHAGVQGKRIKRAPQGKWHKAYYNPYTMNTFQIKMRLGLAPLLKAKYAKLTPTGLYVILE